MQNKGKKSKEQAEGYIREVVENHLLFNLYWSREPIETKDRKENELL